MKLSTKILIAMLTGLLFGFILSAIPENPRSFIILNILEPMGKIFLSFIQLIIVPFILTSLIVSVAKLGDPKKIGSYTTKVFILYLITVLIALGLGLSAGIITRPGEGMSLISQSVSHNENVFSITEFVINMIPSNPFKALAEGSTLQVIILSILMGIGIALAGDKGKLVLNFLESANHVVIEMTNIIMKTTPYGVFALIAVTVSTLGFEILIPLTKYILMMSFILSLQGVLVYGIFIKLVGKIRPIRFFKGILLPLQISFTTCTSITVLPITIKALIDNLGVSERIAHFSVPFGMSVKKDGAAIFHSFTALFIAQAYGIHLTLSQYFMIGFITIIVSFSSAGIPGGGIIMLSMVLGSAGLPIEGIALIAGVDRLTDMFRSALNVLGVAACGTGLASLEGEIDRHVVNREVHQYN